jgi:hypothetical protein
LLVGNACGNSVTPAPVAGMGLQRTRPELILFLLVSDAPLNGGGKSILSLLQWTDISRASERCLIR